MSRPSRGDRAAAKGRPKRKAAVTHFFKYQLANNPSRAEGNDLKRALQQSLEEQSGNTKTTRLAGANSSTSINNNNNNNSHSSNNHHQSSRLASLKSHLGAHSSSDLSSSNTNTTISSNVSESVGSIILNATTSSLSSRSSSSLSAKDKRTRSKSHLVTPPVVDITPSKRAKLSVSVNEQIQKHNNHPNNNNNQHATSNSNNSICDGQSGVSLRTAKAALNSPTNLVKTTTTSQTNSRAIRTYSRTQPDSHVSDNFKTSTPLNKATSKEVTQVADLNSSNAKNLDQISKSTQTQTLSVWLAKPNNLNTTTAGENTIANNGTKSTPTSSTPGGSQIPSSTSSETTKTTPCSDTPNAPIQDQYLKFKRESKNYAYVKMTALKVSTSKSPSSNSKSNNQKRSSPNGILNNNDNKSNSVGSVSTVKVIQKTTPSGDTGSFRSTSKAVHSDSIIVTNRTVSSTTNIRNDQGGKKSPNCISTKPRQQDATKTPKNLKVSPGQHCGKTSIPKHNLDNFTITQSLNNDCSPKNTLDLSEEKNQNQAGNVKYTKRCSPAGGSWSLIGVPEEKLIYLRDDEPPRRLICYPAIKHVEGDVIQVRDSVLLRSGARKTDLPYIAKVCSLWKDGETGNVMMSLFWYYRPEQTEEGRRAHHLMDEVFASRHRDMDSVECIEDKCYVLTFNEYCRYKKRCKMEQMNTNWSLTDVTIPVSNESYPRRNRIPDSDVNPELIFCCRQIYDSRMRRLVKNPLINPKYGHI